MLPHKSPLHEIEACAKLENIPVMLSDRPYCNLSFLLPSVEELKNIRKKSEGAISVNDIVMNDPFDMSEVFRVELSELEKKLDKYSDNHEFLNHLFYVCMLTGDVEKAENYISKAIGIDANELYSHNLSELFLHEGRIDDAFNALKECDLETDIYANLRIAYLYAKNNKLEESKKYLKNALSIDASDYSATMFLGAIHLWNHDWEKAVRNYRVAAEENPISSTLYMNLAIAYWGMGNDEKTLKSLRKSLALDPLNKNAIYFYSDVLFYLEKQEKMIHTLKTYLRYEQNDKDAWARLGQAHYEIGFKNNDKESYKKSLSAIEMQVSLDDDCFAWSNMGVVCSALKEKSKAKRYYAQAVQKAKDQKKNIGLPLYNLLGILVEAKEYEHAYKFSSQYLQDSSNSVGANKYASKIYLQNIICLEAFGKRKEAVKRIESILDGTICDVETEMDFLSHLFYFYTYIEPDIGHVKKYLPLCEKLLVSDIALSGNLEQRAVNNIVFSLLQYDENIKYVNKYLPTLIKYVHKDPYSTATFGLFNMKNGKFDKAIHLYEEAISLLNDFTLKRRFKQRQYFEMGNYYLDNLNMTEATKYFKKAEKEKNGLAFTANQAKERLLEIKIK